MESFRAGPGYVLLILSILGGFRLKHMFSCGQQIHQHIRDNQRISTDENTTELGVSTERNFATTI